MCAGYTTPTVVKRWLQQLHAHQRLVAVTRLPACVCTGSQRASGFARDVSALPDACSGCSTGWQPRQTVCHYCDQCLVWCKDGL